MGLAKWTSLLFKSWSLYYWVASINSLAHHQHHIASIHISFISTPHLQHHIMSSKPHSHSQMLCTSCWQLFSKPVTVCNCSRSIISRLSIQSRTDRMSAYNNKHVLLLHYTGLLCCTLKTQPMECIYVILWLDHWCSICYVAQLQAPSHHGVLVIFCTLRSVTSCALTQPQCPAFYTTFKYVGC